MKRTILVMLIKLIATPCFAQEIETDGLFSIEGTEWRCVGVEFKLLPFTNSPPMSIELIDETVYFTERSIQTSSGNIGILQEMDTYLDFLVFSVAWGVSGINVFWHASDDVSFMVLQPTIGVGIFSSIIRLRFPGGGKRIVGFGFGFMFKIDDDDWTPPDVE